MGRINQGQTQSDQVDHQETTNRTHSGDDLSPATLEATNTLIDANGTNHTGEIADLADVSSIQTSADVVVTDTQAGTIADQEFLKNEGGNLTGATVSTTPNIPDFSPDSNNPADVTNSTSATLNINSSYDIYWIFYYIDSNGGGDKPNMQVDSTTGNYDYWLTDGTTNTGASSWPIGRLDGAGVETGGILLNAAGRNISMHSMAMPTTVNGRNVVTKGVNTSVGSPLDSVTISSPSTENRIVVEAFGRNIT